jgi:Zn-dependent M28 family amino/carboxypeptidase
MAEAALAPFSKGANDNATGAGLVLTLGEQLARAPLRHTRVWLVCSGCEEVKHYGAMDFYRRHRDDFVNPRAIAFEMLGCDGPGYLIRESTISLFAIHASAEMVAFAASVACQHPELGAHPTQVEGGHSEMADAIHAGVPAITIAGIDEGGTRFNYDGPNLYWHHKDDVPANLNPDVLERNYAYVWELVQALDAQDTESRDQRGPETIPNPEPHMFFPALERLARSRYPKANPQQIESPVQATSTDPVSQVEDD